MKSRNGGPAFPITPELADLKGIGAEVGMSLRDYFSVHAPEMPSHIKTWNFTATDEGTREYAEAVARWEYVYADAKLKARQS